MEFAIVMTSTAATCPFPIGLRRTRYVPEVPSWELNTAGRFLTPPCGAREPVPKSWHRPQVRRGSIRTWARRESRRLHDRRFGATVGHPQHARTEPDLFLR